MISTKMFSKFGSREDDESSAGADRSGWIRKSQQDYTQSGTVLPKKE
jgi:hypothetical protein